MKIDGDFNGRQISGRVGSNLDALEQILRDSRDDSTKAQGDLEQVAYFESYSAFPHKEINNQIGVLQIAQRTLSNILSNSHITLDEVYREINNAQFLGSGIFSDSMILSSGSGEVLFDANRILNILPSDERDLYIFKKALKNEVDFIAQSLQNLHNESIGVSPPHEDFSNAKDYLVSNAMLFSKTHNTASLRNKIDALLA